MIDEDGFILVHSLYDAVRRERDRQLFDHTRAVVQEAASKGTLGAGFVRQQIGKRHVDELRQRGDSLSVILRQVAKAYPVPPFTEVAHLDRHLYQIVMGEADILNVRIGEAFKRLNASPGQFQGQMNDEVARVIEKLRAELQLFERQTATVDKPAPVGSDAGAPLPDGRRVFVVHGRNARLARDLFALLRSVGLQPIEWRDAVKETRKGSPYVGEILESSFSVAQAIVVLLSPDDEVRLSPDLVGESDTDEERELRRQPRPNVLFEAGMAFGYRPDRTILVEVGDPKPFSDVSGRHVVRLTNSTERRNDLIERLRTAGCAVKPDGEEWRSVGNFEIEPKARPSETAQGKALSVKTVDLDYPKDSGLLAALSSDGYEVRWCPDDKLARRLDIDGWSLATAVDQAGNESILRLKDLPSDQTLIKRRRG